MEGIGVSRVAEMGTMKGCHRKDFTLEGTWFRQWDGALSKENRASELTAPAVTFPKAENTVTVQS